MRSIHLLVVVLSASLMGCVEASAPARKVVQPENALMRVVTTPATMILAVGDTARIALSALNVLGDTIMPSESSAIQWTSPDSLIVAVDAKGVVTARKATGGSESISLTAKWSQHGVTKSTTVSVFVTATRLSVNSLQIVSRDSTRTSFVGFERPWNWAIIIARNAQGDSLMAPMLPLAPTPSSKVGTLGVQVQVLGSLALLLGGTGPYLILSRHIGEYWLYTEAMVYGTMMRDSLKFTGLYNAVVTVPIVRDSLANVLVSPIAGSELAVQPCGLVKFHNQSQTPIDIIFDDSTKAAQCVATDPVGNIANILPGTTASRKFPAVGTIQWTVRDRNIGQLVPAASGKVSMRVP